METGSVALNPFTRASLNMQGFINLSDEAKARYAWGLRFTPALCSTLAIAGLLLQSWLLLLALAGVALVGALFPAGHPLDLAYNYLFRHLFGGDALPQNPLPRRFACFMASLFLGVTVGAFLTGIELLAYGAGGFLAGAALVTAATHWCLPSFMYGLLRRVLSLPVAEQ